MDHNILYLKILLTNNLYKKNARSLFISNYFLLNKKKVFSKSDFRLKWLSIERKKTIIKQLQTIKKKFNEDIYDLSLNFLFYDNFVNKIIIGIKDISQLNDFLKRLKIVKKNFISVEFYKKFYFSKKIFEKKGF